MQDYKPTVQLNLTHAKICSYMEGPPALTRMRLDLRNSVLPLVTTVSIFVTWQCSNNQRYEQ